ncbi:hypothetical protein [Edaphobacter aggregans]|uniref:hypothetical protein n=1 Tax=Edaphobacter aggregans TaxID=570835 RepID=UPI000558AD6F|nr:hypothetical protein [Edaphobacter aggregans]
MNSLPLVIEQIEGTRVQPLRKVFSFPAMLAGVLVALAALTVRSRFNDPDTWWHLKMGEIIWTTHRIPTTDLFSYTTNHHPYTAHEWLSQVFIYGAYRFGGYPGLMLWLCLFTAALLVAGYGLCWLYSENAKVAFVGALTIWLFATVGLAVRPQMIGYLLLVVELLLIHLGQTRNPRWFLGLPPLFTVWVNCHGSFFLGLLVAGAYLFSSLFDFQWGLLVSQRWHPLSRRMLVLALVMSLAALFLNPIGVKQVLNPLETMLHLPINLNQVVEWQPLQLGDPRGLALLGLIGSIFLLLIVRQSNLFWHELLLFALGIWLAASHQRMLFPFGILVAPILSRLLSSSWDGYNATQDRPLPNAVLIAISLLITFWAFPNRQNLTRQIEEQSPVKAVEFMNTHDISGRMLNDYVYGGYLIWAAPHYPVFVDGRGDIFEQTGVLGDFEKWATLKGAPDLLLDKYHIDFCLLSRNSPMVFVLQLLPNWKAIYSDNNSTIFVRVP